MTMGLAETLFLWCAFAGVIGVALAFLRNRNKLYWGFGCFLFPPLLLVIVFLPKALRAGPR